MFGHVWDDFRAEYRGSANVFFDNLGGKLLYYFYALSQVNKQFFFPTYIVHVNDLT